MGKAADTLKSFLRIPADAVIASSKKLPYKIRSETYTPYAQDIYIVPKLSGNRQAVDEHIFPVPPKDLWLGYGVNAAEYLSFGEADVDMMTNIANSSNFSLREGTRVLDLGCGAGRMIRWLDKIAAQCEIWGLDINAPCIKWCQQNLSPPFKFATITTNPHLPFEDKYFDFVYCGSVFTHIDDLADAWLLEIKRITSPGGRVFITVHDKHTVDLIMNHPEECRGYDQGIDFFREYLTSYDTETNFTRLDYCMFSVQPGGPNSQVFYDIDFLCQHWGHILDVLSVTPEAYGKQTAILLAK
jgi:SAM-dependent methyltransferase